MLQQFCWFLQRSLVIDHRTLLSVKTVGPAWVVVPCSDIPGVLKKVTRDPEELPQKEA